VSSRDGAPLNVVIERTSLGPEAHGIFTFWLHIKADGWGQGFGGWQLTDEHATPLLQRILEVVGVDEWEQLKGKHIRVVSEDGVLCGIGNIVKDEWLFPKNFFAGRGVK
jgi:hypothetical protein